MSNSNLFQEARNALYKAARNSAYFVDVKLASQDTDFTSADKERLKVALSVLKVTWLSKDNDRSDEHGNTPIYPEYESDEYGNVLTYPEYEFDEYGDISIYPEYEIDVDNIPL